MIRPILLVEDNPDDELLAIRAIRKQGVANPVVVARDGVEALDVLLRRGAHAERAPETDPAVVLLDLKLPRVDGLEVLRAVRADPRVRLTPVVVLTSSKEEQDLVQSYELGANAYVRKPVDFTQFVDAIHHLGLFWLVHNEPPPVVGIGARTAK